MHKFTLSCILHNKEVEFYVELNKNRTVRDLQEAIKSINSDLATYCAHDPMLYLLDTTSIKDARYKSQNLSSLKRLEASQELSSIFGTKGSSEGRIHILVTLPAGESIKSGSLVPLLRLL